MSASNRFTSRRRFSRLVAGVGLLGLAVAALGIGYSQTPKQSKPLTTKGQLTLQYEHVGKVVYRITPDGRKSTDNEAKLLVASPEICQRIALLIPYGIFQYRAYNRKLTLTGELRMFDSDRMFDDARSAWEGGNISKNMLGINYTKLCVIDLRNFKLLANGATLEPLDEKNAIEAAQRAFKTIRALKSPTNGDKNNPIMGAFRSLAKIDANSAFYEVVGGVVYCPEYAVGFRMDCETDEEFIKNFTISCQDEELKQSVRQKILGLIYQIGSISLPWEYLEEVSIVASGQRVLLNEPNVEKMKSKEYCDAINQLIQILYMFLGQSLVEKDQNGRVGPPYFQISNSSVKFKFFQSISQLKRPIFRMAAARRELFLQFQTCPWPHVPFRPDERQSQAHLDQDARLVKDVIDQAKELQKTFRTLRR